MTHFIFFLFLIFVSFLFAKVEIAIEGESGWAEKMPTWRLSKQHWVSKIFFGGRSATGYHVWVNLFIISLLHIVYIFVNFSVAIEIRLISFLVLFWICEDFLWFVFNPAFGIKNFRKEKIWWHRDQWWSIAPREYFIFLPISIILYLLSF